MTDHADTLAMAGRRLRKADSERQEARQRLITAIRIAADPGGLTVPQIAVLSGYSRQHIHRLLSDRSTP